MAAGAKKLVFGRRGSSLMLVLLGVAVFVYNLGAGLYHAGGLEPPPTIEFLYTSIFLCGVVWWLRTETTRSAVTPVYCAGLLVGAGWFFIIPYHLLRTRGWRGLVPLFALIGSFFAGHVLAIIVYTILFHGLPTVSSTISGGTPNRTGMMLVPIPVVTKR
jgi:hypothetical protein